MSTEPSFPQEFIELLASALCVRDSKTRLVQYNHRTVEIWGVVPP